MKVSIIIPVYNVAEDIERCLLSVLNQTWEELEVILVNDCSPDNAMEVVDKVIQSHPRGNIVSCLTLKRNQGVSVARNTGIRHATGDYIYCCDGDDYLPFDGIASLAEAAVHDNFPDFVVGNHETVGYRNWVLPLSLPTCVIKDNESIFAAFVNDAWPIIACNKLINHSFLLSNNLFFPEGIPLSEDEYQSFLIACVANRMSVVNKTTYYYAMRVSSVTHTRHTSTEKLWHQIDVIKRMYEVITASESLKNNPLTLLYFERLKGRFFYSYLYYPDAHFHYQSYKVLRKQTYISSFRTAANFLPIKHLIVAVHYYMPILIGYCYYKGLFWSKKRMITLKNSLRHGK
jgi:glycosyltransferase involved in cell wall biosynthesis